MIETGKPPLLGKRLGLSFCVSPFRIRLHDVARRYPSPNAGSLEDWLLDVANARGARIVMRDPASPPFDRSPPEEELSNAELITAICQLQGEDQPQLLRLAAQLISRCAVDLRALERLAVRERTGSVLAALARETLKVAPDHPYWRALAERFASAPIPHDTLLHWTRLAEPVMAQGRCNAASWRLVA